MLGRSALDTSRDSIRGDTDLAAGTVLIGLATPGRHGQADIAESAILSV